MSELSDHLEDMADSLDEVVSHEDIYRLLIEALHLARNQNAKLDAVESLADNYNVRASYWPEPKAQWRDIETDLRVALKTTG